MVKPEVADTRSRTDHVVESAREVFIRYGFARTTMGDIAQSAGISRPALYLIFPRKDDIFAAVMKQMSDEMLRDLRLALPRLRTLERRLRFCCTTWGAHGYDLMQAHPDAKDLFDLSFPSVRETYAAFETFLTELLEDAASASGLRTSPQRLARVIVYAMRGFKDVARDGKHMREMITLQVDVLVAALKT